MENARESPLVSSAFVEEGESEGNFLEVQTFEQGIKNEKLKGSRELWSEERHDQQ